MKILKTPFGSIIYNQVGQALSVYQSYYIAPENRTKFPQYYTITRGDTTEYY